VQTAALDVDFGLVALVGDTAPPRAQALVELGRGCGGPTGNATLALAGTPRLGGTVQVALSGLALSQPGLLLFGSDDLTWTALGAPLPAAMAPLGMNGCTLYLDPIGSQLVVADNLGAASVSLPVPANAALIGTEHLLQAVFADPLGTNPARAGATSGGRVLLGN